MNEVGIRALKQNASAVVADVVAGNIAIVTDRGRPVARIVPLTSDPIQTLIEAGLARPPKGSWADLPLPSPVQPGERSASEILRQMRDDERY